MQFHISRNSWIVMDIIEHCLALTPVPGLAAAFSILRYIASSVIQAQASKQQLIVLTTVTAQLMMTLNAEFDAGRLSPDKSAEPLYTLQRWVLRSGYCLRPFIPRKALETDIEIRSTAVYTLLSEIYVHQRASNHTDWFLSPSNRDSCHLLQGDCRLCDFNELAQ